MSTLHFRWIPEETGWIIDGFPTNLYQAKVLEKALTGFSAGDKKDDKSSGKMKRSNLVKDPRPTPPPADPASGLDVVINFEVPDELCLKRSAGRLRMYPILSMWIFIHLNESIQFWIWSTRLHEFDLKMFVKYVFLVALQANEQYHQEFKPPPEGSMTGVGRQEQVIPVQDMSHDQDQIQQRYFLFV